MKKSILNTCPIFGGHHKDLILKIQSGYKIPQIKRKPNSPSLTEDEILVKSWKAEVIDKIGWFIMLTLLLIIIFNFIYLHYFPTGFFEFTKTQSVFLPKTR